MRLLIITQKADKKDPILGFFHSWIEGFSKHFEKIIVICLEEGRHDFPSNVSVFSLGKEKGYSKLRILKNFYSLISEHRKDYDKVFVHMNPIYIVFSGFIWKFIFKKEVFLWYTHKSVDLKLRIAEKFVKKIFSASKESFRLQTEKLVVTGHGIDTDLFRPDYSKKNNEKLTILSVGRIAETKGIHVFVEALSILKKHNVPSEMLIVGSPALKPDQDYQKSLVKMIKEKDLEEGVKFIGPVSNTQSVKYFQAADVFVHASDTGSLDKVVLEAMACGTPVVTSNDAAVPIVSRFNSNFVFKKGDVRDLAEKLIYFSRMKNNLHYLQEDLRREMVEKHSLPDLISKLFKEMR